MLDYMEGIGRRYGAYGDRTTLDRGIVPEIGGVIGVLNGRLVASRIYSGREMGYPSGGMNLAFVRDDVMRQHPEFRPSYDWHFHPSSDLMLGGDRAFRTDYGFSSDDVDALRLGAVPLRGSYLVMPDRVLFLSRAEANRIPRDSGYAPASATRRWNPTSSPWPWRWPH